MVRVSNLNLIMLFVALFWVIHKQFASILEVEIEIWNNGENYRWVTSYKTLTLCP